MTGSAPADFSGGNKSPEHGSAPADSSGGKSPEHSVPNFS